ncbi:MAG: DNA polymerase I [Spirochaetes bacterium]|nr:DNA polymerase I [Spirochaetota bacterium]
MVKRLYAIDGHALCYRAYYAFIKNPLINSKGQNISAIYGFARMLIKLIQEEKPDYLVVAFDPPGKTFRFEMFPDYKANRLKMPDDLRPQIDEIKRMIGELGIPVIEHPEYEADDVLGSIAKKYSSPNLTVVLVTGDKDAYQLIDNHTTVYANKKGISEHEMYDRSAVIEKLGITPEQVIDYMALVGDTSDNVPGIKGIGEKTAQKLIHEYGSLDNIYRNLNHIKGKLRELLEKGKESAYLSRQLVTICTNLDVPLDLGKLKTPQIETEKAREYFRKMEMPSIAKELGEDAKEKSITYQQKEYIIIKSDEQLKEVLKQIESIGFVSIDTETTSISPIEAELVGISLSIREGSGWYIPIQTQTLFSTNTLDAIEALSLMKPFLENEKIAKIGQNIKYDIIVLKNAGIDLKGIYFDTMIASYVLNPSERNHNLDDMAKRYLGYTTITYDELVGKGKKAVPITEVPLEKLAEYAIEDADITLRLHNYLRPKLESEDEISQLFRSVEMPLIEVLAEMEWHGVKIDLDHFKNLAEENASMLASIEQKIYTIAGSNFNINSTRELSNLLFQKLKLKPIKKTKTGFSTDIAVLEELKGKHEIIDHLIEYRTLTKLKSTYIDALPKLVSPKTGRIHTSYNQTIVATGRLSSSSPNLQNIPIRDEMGKRIREGFVPEKGYLLMSADYSQIELRLAAHLSGDERMIRAFNEGLDIHNITAASVFGVNPEDVTPEMRRKAKIINFATIYGVSPYGLSQQADISVQEAAEFIKKHFEAYPGLERYIRETIEFARKHGYVKTLLGRRRLLPDINSDAKFQREGAERVAINTPIQGTSADMIKIAMVKIHNEIKTRKLGTRMIIQVHDELVFEVPENEKEIIEPIVRTEMENAIRLTVPVVVDIGWGKNWTEAH